MGITHVEGFRLSVQQARLWSVQEENLMPCSLCAIFIEGCLDSMALQWAVAHIVKRHEVLRTGFALLPGMEVPVQIVHQCAQALLPVICLEALEETLQLEKLDELIASAQKKYVDLENDPALSLYLVRLSSYSHMLLMTLPALNADAATLRLCVAEIQQAYATYPRCEHTADEPLQYADVAAWQDELLLEEETEPQSHYWKRIDLSQLSTQRLPFDRDHHRNGAIAGREQYRMLEPQLLEMSLSEVLTAQIRARVQQYGISASAWFLTCWQAALWHLCNEAHFLVGVACDGRVYEELTGALGLYTRFVPVEAHFTRELPFEQALLEVNKSFQEACERQMYFTWETVSDNTRQLFFPVSFEYENWPATFALEKVTLSLYRRFSCIEPFFLKLSVLEVGERLRLALHYDQQKFAPEQMQRLTSVLQTLLLNTVEQPQTPLGQLNILALSEREHALKTFKAPTRALPNQLLHQLFEAQAACGPHQQAVMDAQEALTYQQLNSSANQLARVLLRRGVGPDTLVALCLPRSVRMIVGMLAILKAGGAYVPLDPQNPATRLAFQLQNSQASLLLTQQELLPRLSCWQDIALCIDAISEEVQQESENNLPLLSSPQDLAYVMYTSGSTGVPKGVMIQQRSVVNYTLALCDLLQCEPGWQYATVSTLAADLGNTVIFCSLASGGCLQVLDYATITSGEAFAQWMAQHPIDVLKIVPSHLSALLSGDHSLAPRRALIMGGEALTLELLARLRKTGSTCAVYNHYGPTEATIGVLVNPLGDLRTTGTGLEQAHGSGTVPLGRPIANGEAYVLNRSLQMVPVSVEGELYLGGPGLASGYLDNPEQTAERFIPHPFVGTRFTASESGARLYRTGDLAHYTAQGQIVFLGRYDNQIKLRGYRIELEEIEAVLRRCPQVQDAVVMLREDVSTEPRITGYVVPKQKSMLTSKQLSEFVQGHLPEYMAPSEYVFLEALPFTTNGKVDRQRLPRPDLVKNDERVAPAMPRNPFEEMLLDTWKDLLSTSEIGIHDNFFQLGGHSLLATRVISQIRAVFQVELPIQALFEAPTIAVLARRVEQALHDGEGHSLPPLIAVARGEGNPGIACGQEGEEGNCKGLPLPLSFAQQRLWILDQLEPDSTAYLNSRNICLRGVLNFRALELALRAMIERHESLRTTFCLEKNQPVQVIHPAGTFCLPVVDLRDLCPQEREAEVQRLIEQEARQPCSLARGPLLRLRLLRLETEVAVLGITVHHIITDDWSNRVFYQELTALYNAFCGGKASSLAPLPLQYADFAVWQRQWLQGEIREAQLAYWQKQLNGAPALALATDFPRPPVQTFKGAYEAIDLPASLSQQLVELSHQEGVTLFMLLLATFQVLLARYTGQDDICVGTPIANRTRGELEGLIGFFLNTLVLRTDLSGNPSFKEVLKRVQKVALEAYAHQDIPFEQLIEILRPERDMSRSPLFQTMFTVQQDVAMDERLDGLELSPLETGHHTSRFDITCFVTIRAQGWHCGIEYNTDLFKRSTIQRMLDHWHTLLTGIATMPHLSLSALPLLSAREEQTLLIDWNNTRTPLPNVCLHTLFEQQVSRTPDAIALIFEDTALTYEQLNRRANVLAHQLLYMGLRPESIVGIAIDRSLLLSIGLLGILKAGAAYLPLDPSYPGDRLAFMLHNARAGCVVTTETLRPRMMEVCRQASDMVEVQGEETEPRASHRVVSIESVLAEQVPAGAIDQAWENPTAGLHPDNLAYVIYTSGSTGLPKGAMNTHRAIVNRLQWMQEEYRLCSCDRVLQKTPTSFDVSVWELFWPLLAGAQLVMARPHGHVDTAYLVEVMREQAISILHFVPSMLQVFLEEKGVEGCGSVRRVICSGEALNIQLQERFYQWMQADLENLYGPTEAAVDVTFWHCQPEGSRSVVPIGRPLSNIQIYLLDRQMQVVPIGVIGELYIGGVGVARGYVRQPALTAERFMPNPFGQQEGARLYRTGDLARYQPDGSLEFLGRKDHQIKIRGCRIELGEIERTLQQHPAVHEAVVLAWTDPSGNTNNYGREQLAAYVVPTATPPSESELRGYLREKLPAYMVPAFFVPLSQLPLTSNGKVNRHALPAPERSASALDASYAPPTSAMEHTVTEVWQEVLQMEKVGIHTNFFDLGGHSLLLIRARNRLQELLQTEVSVVDLFRYSTVSSLARYLEQVQDNTLDLQAMQSQARKRKGAIRRQQQRMQKVQEVQ